MFRCRLEVSGQKSEVSGQRSVVSGQWSEVRFLKIKVRNSFTYNNSFHHQIINSSFGS